jgi:DNA replication protein DnaC
LQAEAYYRSERATRRRLKPTKLPIRVYLADFVYSDHRLITKAQIRELQNLSWLRAGRPLVVIGQTGVAQSSIVQAIGTKVRLHGKSALALRMNVTTWLEDAALAHSYGPTCSSSTI